MAALAIFVGWLFVAGSQVPGFSHATQPVAFAGMRGVAGAFLFNTMVFVLPGTLLALVALRLRQELPIGAGWLVRIGASLLLLSTLAFAAQGFLPLDPQGIDEGSSRLHASAWMAWWIAFCVGAPMFASGARRGRVVAFVAALFVLSCSLFGSGWMPAGTAQRIAFLGWFSWFLFAAVRDVTRGAA